MIKHIYFLKILYMFIPAAESDLRKGKRTYILDCIFYLEMTLRLIFIINNYVY